MINVCHALEFAHSHSIVHRDIKSDNIMVGAFNEVYLMDWGLSFNLTNPGAGGYREHDILVIGKNGVENITKFPFGPDYNIIKA